MTVLVIIIAVLLFGLVILIHEGGHFVTAKLCGIQVNEFAIGMGPKLFHFTKGETEYSLRLFPIGGFCAMEGEDEESDNKNAFEKKPIWKRALVIAMGAIMNMVLGFVFVMILLIPQQKFMSTTISVFQDNSATQAAGLQVGDRITGIDGYWVNTDKDLSFALALANPNDVDLTVQRDGKMIEFSDIKFHTTQAQDGSQMLALDFYVMPVDKNFGTVMTKTFDDTVSTVRMVWASLAGIAQGRFGLKDIAGPVGTFSVIGKVASQSVQNGGFQLAMENMLYLIMVITVNLAVVNLLPLPALDGGKLLLLLIEKIRRKPLNRKIEERINTVGFALLMALMMLVTVNDVVRIFNGTGIGG